MSILSPVSPSPTEPATRSAANQRAWLPPLLLAAIVLVAVAGDLAWIAANEILIGRDASGYLQRTLEYPQLLSPLSWQGIFQAFVFPPYRTPALYIAAQPFLAIPLPGGAMDSAQLLNVLLHGGVILLTFWLACQTSGVWPALFAAFMAAFLPMLAAMSRLFYTEMFLTAMVILNLLALYKANGFTNRRWSLVWGASAGIGMLVKWTFPIYVALPLVVVIWQQRRALMRVPAWSPRAAMWALLGALLFAAIWWLPNRSVAAGLPAGDWAALGWVLIAWGCLYAIQVAPRHGRWLIAALLLGLWIASLWYLPHSDFAKQLLATDMERGSDPPGLFDWNSYAAYFDYLYQDNFGALLFWILIPASAAPWLWTLARNRKSLNADANLLWWSLLSAMLILTFLSQRNPRNLVPLLPQAGILLSIGLWGWGRLPRWIFGSVAAVILLVQWGMVTFNALTPLQQRSEQLWVVQDYAFAPNAGRAADGFNIAPSLLQAVAKGGNSTIPETLGLMVNAEYLHRGNLRYQARTLAQPIETTDLTEANATWQAVIENQWIAVKDGDNRDVEEAGLALIDRIAAGDPLFDALYAPVERYPLPNGETVTLYRRDGPGLLYADPARDAESTQLAQAIREVLPADATLIFADHDSAVWVGRHDLAARPIVFGEDVNERIVDALRNVRGTIFAVLNDDDITLRQWLDISGYKASEVGGDYDYALVYGVPDGELESLPTPPTWSDANLAITELRSVSHADAGDVIPVEISAEGADQPNLKWSIRLTDAQGATLAAVDRVVQSQDRFGLFLPPSAAAGAYNVVARLYDATTFAPIANDASEEETTLFKVVSP